MDEGNDAEAYKAAMEIAKSCLQLLKAGVKIRGRPTVRYNWWSKRTEFMHNEDGFQHIHRELQGTEEKLDAIQKAGGRVST